MQGVASDKYGIGYSGIGYKTADVRAVPLAAKANAKAIEASPDNAYSGDYPLARFLYIYVNYKPGASSTRCAANSSATSSASTDSTSSSSTATSRSSSPWPRKRSSRSGSPKFDKKPADEKPAGSDGKQR